MAGETEKKDVGAEKKQKIVGMKHLFMVRHGQIGPNGKLAWGGGDFASLATDIKHTVDRGSLYMVSSTAPRALESARVLIERLPIANFEHVEQIPYLWAAPDGPADGYYRDLQRSEIMRIINERRLKADGLIVMGHATLIEEFHPYFIREEFKAKGKLSAVDAGYSKAICYDITKKDFYGLPHR